MGMEWLVLGGSWGSGTIYRRESGGTIIGSDGISSSTMAIGGSSCPPSRTNQRGRRCLGESTNSTLPGSIVVPGGPSLGLTMLPWHGGGDEPDSEWPENSQSGENDRRKAKTQYLNRMERAITYPEEVEGCQRS
jgi:hypothetical protein